MVILCNNKSFCSSDSSRLKSSSVQFILRFCFWYTNLLEKLPIVENPFYITIKFKMTSRYTIDYLKFNKLTTIGSTKGSILVADTSTNFVSFPAGSDGQIIYADSTTTEGIKWANVSPFPAPVTTNTIYANAATGSDSNDGTTSGTAVQTIQKALDLLGKTLATTGIVQLEGASTFAVSGTLNFFPATATNGKIIIRGTKDSVVSDTVSSVGTVSFNRATDNWALLIGNTGGYTPSLWAKKYIHNTTTDKIYSVYNNTSTSVSILSSPSGGDIDIKFNAWTFGNNYDLFDISKTISFSSQVNILTGGKGSDITFEYVYFNPTTTSGRLVVDGIDENVIFRGCRLDGNNGSTPDGTYEGPIEIQGCYSLTSSSAGSGLTAMYEYSGITKMISFYVEGGILKFHNDCVVAFVYMASSLGNPIMEFENVDVYLNGVWVNSSSFTNTSTGIKLDNCQAEFFHVYIDGQYGLGNGILSLNKGTTLNSTRLGISSATTSTVAVYINQSLMHCIDDVNLASNGVTLVLENNSTFTVLPITITTITSSGSGAILATGNSTINLNDNSNTNINQAPGSSVSLIRLNNLSKMFINGGTISANCFPQAIDVRGGSKFAYYNQTGAQSIVNNGSGPLFVAVSSEVIITSFSGAISVSSGSNNFAIDKNSKLTLDTLGGNSGIFMISNTGSNIVASSNSQVCIYSSSVFSTLSVTFQLISSLYNFDISENSHVNLTFKDNGHSKIFQSATLDNFIVKTGSSLTILQDSSSGSCSYAATSGVNFRLFELSKFVMRINSGASAPSYTNSGNNIVFSSQSSGVSIPNANGMTSMIIGGTGPIAVATSIADFGTQNCTMYVGP